MTQIVFQKPDAKTPGYMKRMRSLLEFQEAQRREDATNLDRFENMIDFLLPYVVEPVDRDEAKEALMDATQEQIDGLMELIAGKTDIIPPVKGES